MVSGVASTLPNLAAKPKRRGQSLVELPLISPSIADRLARRAPNSYMLSGKQMEEAMGILIICQGKGLRQMAPHVRQALPNAESSADHHISKLLIT
jgi:hypothetical protein